MTERKWWNCEVDKDAAEKYKRYFREHGIYFEPSECYNLIHIEFKISDDELKELDKWIKEKL